MFARVFYIITRPQFCSVCLLAWVLWCTSLILLNATSSSSKARLLWVSDSRLSSDVFRIPSHSPFCYYISASSKSTFHQLTFFQVVVVISCPLELKKLFGATYFGWLWKAHLDFMKNPMGMNSIGRQYPVLYLLLTFSNVRRPYRCYRFREPASLSIGEWGMPKLCFG